MFERGFGGNEARCLSHTCIHKYLLSIKIAGKGFAMEHILRPKMERTLGCQQLGKKCEENEIIGERNSDSWGIEV